jgi:hypothetical protein
MFGDQRQEATKYVIKEGYQDIYFLNKNGEWYYFEVRSAWRGKHIIRVKDGLLGWRKEIVTDHKDTKYLPMQKNENASNQRCIKDA